jgi:tRNA pseudouridine55 synthase
LATAAQGFLGEIRQRPPAFSALKLQGRRAYDLARRGKQVELAPRPVMIYKLEIVSYAYPELVLDVECGSGTYIRSLGRDLAESLGTAAVMAALRRTAIGPFRAADAAALDTLTAESCRSQLQPLARAVEMLPKIILTAEEIGQLHNGASISKGISPPAAEIAALDSAGRLAAIIGPRSPGLWRPLRNFPGED